mmetsp:Transcript_24877/g.59051  ORF Transcript_24877/g.59051 Transcript_24877/m.59051 type:complete len:204 (-) Transcript_24877:1316-1927(-)
MTTIPQATKVIGFRSCVVVGSTLVTALVHTNPLLQWVNTEPSQIIEHSEPESHQAERPAKDKEYGQQLGADEREVSTSSAPFVEPTSVRAFGICSSDKIWCAEQTCADHTPHTTNAVNGDSVNCVIDSKTDQQFRPQNIEEAGKDTDNDCGPCLDGGTTCSNSNEAGQATIHGSSDVIKDFTMFTPVPPRAEEHCGNGTGTCS